MDAESRGVIAHMNRMKGFGFISHAGGGGDVFFHASALEGGFSEFEGLTEGTAVVFVVTAEPRGRRAENVRVIG